MYRIILKIVYLVFVLAALSNLNIYLSGGPLLDQSNALAAGQFKNVSATTTVNLNLLSVVEVLAVGTFSFIMFFPEVVRFLGERNKKESVKDVD